MQAKFGVSQLLSEKQQEFIFFEMDIWFKGVFPIHGSQLYNWIISHSQHRHYQLWRSLTEALVLPCSSSHTR
jgi:hypothetical protein